MLGRTLNSVITNHVYLWFVGALMVCLLLLHTTAINLTCCANREDERCIWPYTTMFISNLHPKSFYICLKIKQNKSVELENCKSQQFRVLFVSKVLHGNYFRLKAEFCDFVNKESWILSGVLLTSVFCWKQTKSLLRKCLLKLFLKINQNINTGNLISKHKHILVKNVNSLILSFDSKS